jgi:hypothetical protein
MCGHDAKPSLLQVFETVLDTFVDVDIDPAISAAGAHKRRSERSLVEDGMGFEKADGISSAQDGCEIVRLVDVLEQDSEIWLSQVQYLSNALESLWGHGVGRPALQRG